MTCREHRVRECPPQTTGTTRNQPDLGHDNLLRQTVGTASPLTPWAPDESVDQRGLLASRKRSKRSTGSRRSVPCNSSIHPGYSGGRALTSSNCLSSSWVSASSTAARLSSSWSSRFAPMITDVTTGFAKSHASERRAALHPWAFAIGAITSRIFQVRSLSTIGKSKSVRRESAGLWFVRLNLPESKPPASGLQRAGRPFRIPAGERFPVRDRGRRSSRKR